MSRVSTVLLYLIGVVVIAAGLAISIGLHEIGHLVPAKLFGVRVTQYMIGFGRTIVSRTRGETEYGLKLVPLGGYISMVGMFPPARTAREAREQELAVAVGSTGTHPSGRTASTGFFGSMISDARSSSAEQIRPGEEHRAFYRLPVWKRIVIMLGGPTMNLLLGILFTGIVLMGFGVSTPTTTVSAVSKCVVPASAATTTCTPSDAAAPAAAAGIRAGDRIVAIDGTRVSSWSDLTSLIRPASGTALSVELIRDGLAQTVQVTPKRNAIAVTAANGTVERNADGSVKTMDEGFIGISPTYVTVQQPVTAVIPAVWQNVTAVGGVIVDLPQRLVGVAQAAFGSGQRDPNGPIGVVGVGRLAGEITSDPQVSLAAKVASMFGILGGLNIALFVFNLVPLLPLDGGHVIGAIWEGVRRSIAKLFGRRDPGPVDMAKLMPLTFAVAILLGGMSLLLVYADIVRPVSLF